MHALGTPAQFSDGLRSAQHQHGQERQFAAAQVERLAQPVSVFFDAMAGAGDLQHQLFLPQKLQTLRDRCFVVANQGLAARLLVAGVLKSVESEAVSYTHLTLPTSDLV